MILNYLLQNLNDNYEKVSIAPGINSSEISGGNFFIQSVLEFIYVYILTNMNPSELVQIIILTYFYSKAFWRIYINFKPRKKNDESDSK